MTDHDPEDYKNTPDGREAQRLYSDIIYLSRPRSERPRMDLTSRAKIFAPYDALRGFDEAIDDTKQLADEITREELSDERREALSAQLDQLQKGMPVCVQFFVPGHAEPDHTGNSRLQTLNRGTYTAIEGTVAKIDPVNQMLEIEQARSSAGSSSGKIEKHPPTVIRFDDLLSVTPLTS